MDSQLGDLIDDFVQEVEHIDQPSVSNGGTPTRHMYVFHISYYYGAIALLLEGCLSPGFQVIIGNYRQKDVNQMTNIHLHATCTIKPMCSLIGEKLQDRYTLYFTRTLLFKLF